MFRFKSIKTALFAAFVGIIFICFIIFAAFAMPRLRASTIDQIGNDLFGQMALIEGNYASLIESQASPKSIQEKVIETAKLSQSRVTLIDKAGIVLADSKTPFDRLGQLENHGDRPEVVQARIEGRGRSVRFSSTLGTDLIYAAVSLKDEYGGLLGYLRFSVPSTYATQLTLKIYKSMLAALVLAVLAAIFASLLLSSVFTKPIVRLTNIAEKISAGEFPSAIVRRSRFEIRLLEDAVENMSKRLAEDFNKLSFERGQISAILSSMSEGVLATDQKGNVILANPVVENLFGILEPKVIGRSVRESLRNNQIADIFDKTFKSGRLVTDEIGIPSGGKEQTFIVHASPVRDEEGRALGAVCVLYNISDIRRLEKYRSEFVANVSHELKTPLTAIRNYVETLAAGAIDDKEHNRQFLEKIKKHAGNLSALIDDILEISQLENKKGLGPFKKVDIGRVVHRAAETVAGKAAKKGINLSVTCPPEELLVSGIEDHIYRAILNLIDNAINYSEPGGTVSIPCAKREGKIELTVEDTGIGIEKEHIPRIFERFYRVDKARSRDLGGTGLGLSIVKHVMNIHNGQVKVESEPNKGSKFTLIFPVLG
jgi:two-component system phosphate regulon sensor histidine kinase PhoR